MTRQRGDPRPALLRSPLPALFERWWLTLEPGATQSTKADDWAGALVIIESGTLEVHCAAGGHRTFGPGDLVAPGWLPLAFIRNPGDERVRIVGIRLRAAFRGCRPASGAGDGAPG